MVTEMFRGDNLTYDYSKQTGRLNDAAVRFESFDLEAARIIVNGQRYTAERVLLRPGGLTEAERKIYGTPPFNLRIRKLIITAPDDGDAGDVRLRARGAAFYYKNTRLLPIPGLVFQTAVNSFAPSRNRAAYSLTPQVAYNSDDGLLATLRLTYPLAALGKRSALSADIGLSQNVGFRGGVQFDSLTRAGNLFLRARTSDFVTTQLTSGIRLDRLPELQYVSPVLPLFRLKNGRGIGVSGLVNAGRFTERFEDKNVVSPTVRSARYLATLALTTRISDADGLYMDLFRTYARYPTVDQRMNNLGFEIGYAGNFGRRVRGLLSFRDNDIDGSTPFRFDEIEITREFRSTFDFQVSPRYIVPLDLRYDLGAKRFRDKTVGLLRSYKTFAYGLVYQAARGEVRLEFRSGF
jgi:hypothetical protein